MNSFQGRAASRDQEDRLHRELRAVAVVVFIGCASGLILAAVAMSYISEHARAAVWEVEQ